MMKRRLEKSEETPTQNFIKLMTNGGIGDNFKNLIENGFRHLVGGMYLDVLNGAVESNDCKLIRQIISIRLDDDFSKTQDAALALILAKFTLRLDVEKIKLLESAGVQLDFLLNEIDFSVLNIDSDNISLNGPMNLLTAAAGVCSDLICTTGTADISMVQYLIEKGVKPGIADKQTVSALIAGNFELVKQIKHTASEGGIDPTPKNKADAPNSPSLGSSRNIFMPSPGGDNQNNNNLDDYEYSGSEKNIL